MAKSDRAKSARERAAEMRATQAKQDQRRNRLWLTGIVGLVVVLLIGLVAIGLTHKTKTSASDSGATTTTMDPSVVNAVVTVPQTTLDTVGFGTIQTPPKSIGATVTMTADGKPRILYVGAEYCPYCAAERWAVVQALSRFGTWKGLGATESAGGQEVYPKTNTFSLHGATFTSQYVSFTGYEQESNKINSSGTGYTALDKLSAVDETILNKYDAPPYVDKSSAGAIPFVNFGGMWLVSGASYNPAVLQGKTWKQISTEMRDPSTDVSKAIVGSANVLTAAVCQMTKNAPANVCNTTAVTTGAQKLTAG